MPTPALFTPLALRGLTLANRIVIAPMCMYSAEDGLMNDWHLSHYGMLAQSGAAIVTLEATAVLPEGRISWADVGLWDDATEAAMARVLQGIRRWSDMPIAIQLAHAGRKASCDPPWRGGRQLAPDSAQGWQTVGASALPFLPDETAPAALDEAGIARVIKGFGDAAERAARLGIDLIQIHAAHGYLLHSFLSPRSNQRQDQWGGSLENRARLALAVIAEVRARFPAERPVTIRISATDWIEDGFDVAEAAAFARMAEAAGIDAVHVSSGGLDAGQKIPVGPNYQVPLARAVREAVKVPVVAVGLITEPAQAEAIVATGDADMVGIARTVLHDPRWPWHAAAALGAEIAVAPQYLRCQPHGQRAFFKAARDRVKD